MLTARTQEAEKILGLELGADDYVTKPFSAGAIVRCVEQRVVREGIDSGDEPAFAVVNGERLRASASARAGTTQPQTQAFLDERGEALAFTRRSRLGPD